MAGLMSADEIFQQARNAAAAATGLDEKAMQIDYPALKEKIRAASAIAKWPCAISISFCRRVTGSGAL